MKALYKLCLQLIFALFSKVLFSFTQTTYQVLTQITKTNRSKNLMSLHQVFGIRQGLNHHQARFVKETFDDKIYNIISFILHTSKFSLSFRWECFDSVLIVLNILLMLIS